MADAPSLTFATVLADLERRSLDADSARRVFDAIFAGEWNAAQIAGLLVALRLKGETSDIVCAAARAMRAKMIGVEHALPLVFDTCGTGGDGQGTINVSTGAALIVAAAGVPVAKHGNRAASSRAGAADVLGALGIPIEMPPASALEVLRACNICFLFAQEYHPALKYAAGPRRELGVPTVFNLLGPLCNPAQATHQLIGTYSEELRPAMAAALAGLGVKGAWVVRSEDGLDEISPFAPTRVSVLTSGRVEEGVVTPEDFGLRRSPPGAIDGGDAQRNAGILREVLSGAPHPARGALVLNAAAGLAISKDLRLQEAAALAEKMIDSGKARETLESWRTAAKAKAPNVAS